MPKGFIVYVDPETKLKLHFRKDPSGYGVLIINAKNVIYANPTAAFYIEQYLKKEKPSRVALKAKLKFKKVTRKQAIEDYKEIQYKINSLLKGEYCPITYLGFERLNPLEVKTSAPYRADLAITYRCNNKCIHCYSSSPTHKQELSTKQWKKIIDKLYKIGVPNLLFTGGEPTLREDLPELILHAEKTGIITGLVTNGRKLSDKQYLEKLVKAGLDYTQITLESNRKEVHEKITQVKGSWEETVQGIKNALSVGLYVDVNTTLNKYNIDHLDEYVDFLHELGVENISANKLIYSGRALEVKDYFEPTIEETKQALETLLDKAYEYGMKFTWYGVTRYCELNPLEIDLGLKFCSACSITIAIEPDGTVIPCQSYYTPLGNILKDKWDKIWNNPICEEIRNRRYAPEECLKCPQFNPCGGGCPLEIKAR